MDVFCRKELKFIIRERQRQLLEAVLSEKMLPDPHGPATVRNLYFDTPDHRLIRRSLEKPVYKEKLRLRAYDRGQGTVFLEMKKKYKGIVYKRRISLTEQQALDFMERRAPLPQDGQIARELLYFRDFYGNLQPQVYLSYDRVAWFSREDPGLRLTMDRNILFRRDGLEISREPGGQPVLGREWTLLEVKAENAIPLWLTELLNTACIRQTSFSKYGRAYQLGLCGEIQEKRGMNHAATHILQYL